MVKFKASHIPRGVLREKKKKRKSQLLRKLVFLMLYLFSLGKRRGDVFTNIQSVARRDGAALQVLLASRGA